MGIYKTNRTLHKWASIIIALPLLLVLCTGLLLLVKKEFSIIQPPTMKGEEQIPSLSFEQILAVSKTVKQSEISSWNDINRLDVRPSKGIIKIRSHNRIEIQIDARSGNILHVAKRNSDFIESLHDGTFFQKKANLWLMLPTAIITLFLSVTGLILFFYPYIKRAKRKTYTFNNI